MSEKRFQNGLGVWKTLLSSAETVFFSFLKKKRKKDGSTIKNAKCHSLGETFIQDGAILVKAKFSYRLKKYKYHFLLNTLEFIHWSSPFIQSERVSWMG